MDHDAGETRSDAGGLMPPFAGRPADLASSERAADRLPPPMFPGGAPPRPAPPPPPQAAAEPPLEILEADGLDGVPSDAFILPDEPIRRSDPDEAPDAAATFDEALIDPDAPIVRQAPPRLPDDWERVLRGGGEDEEGVVTGIGDAADEALEEELALLAAADGDPHVSELIRAVRRLADGLAARGEAGLRSTPEMSRFETTLRAYCVGYLTRAREEETRGDADLG